MFTPLAQDDVPVLAREDRAPPEEDAVAEA